MKKFIFLILIFSILLTFCSCEKNSTITKQTFAFDTVVNIKLDKKDIYLADKAFEMCRNYEKIFSRTNSDSELFSVNKGENTTLSDDIREVLLFSLEMSSLTDGAFDVTVAPLIDLWNVGERTTPPAESEIESVLSLVGYNKISTEPLNLENCTLDMGAVAKGYIADCIIKEFKKSNTENAIVDLGGNVALIGEHTVGIRDPFDTEKVFATITLKDKSAVTSGAYQRYFEYNGKRYHHIIDPRTGNCADSGIASVTVISDSSMHADALSTSIFVMGKDSISLCDNFPGTDALIIMENGETVTTDGFEEKYNLTLN